MIRIIIIRCLGGGGGWFVRNMNESRLRAKVFLQL